MDETSLNIIKKQVRKPRPVPFTIVTVLADDGAVWLCVYENEVMAYNEDERSQILKHMQGLRTEMQHDGLRIEIIGRPGDPPNKNGSNSN